MTFSAFTTPTAKSNNLRPARRPLARQTKSANTVLSMLQHAIDTFFSPQHSTLISCLLPYAYNGERQDRNKFILIYQAWTSIIGLDNSITLASMLAGHTRNVVDSASSHVRRMLKTQHFKTRCNTMDKSRWTRAPTLSIPSFQVAWRLWKLKFEAFFKMPCSFSIPEFHIFRQGKYAPGVSFGKYFLFALMKKKFNIFTSGIDKETVRKAAVIIFVNSTFLCLIQILAHGMSPHHNSTNGVLILQWYWATLQRGRKLEAGYFRNSTNTLFTLRNIPQNWLAPILAGLPPVWTRFGFR